MSSTHYVINGVSYPRVSYVISEMLALPHANYGDGSAAVKGTQMHADIESYLKGGTDWDNPEFELKAQFEDFMATVLPRSHWRVYAVEQLVHSKTYRIAGTVDAIFEYMPTKELYIIDWKRTAGLYQDSARQYQLQLNIYAAILQETTPISGLMLAMFHPSNDKYKISIVPHIDVRLYMDAAISL